MSETGGATLTISTGPSTSTVESSSFNLTETGSQTSTATTTGNTVAEPFSTTTAGTDNYTMIETGSTMISVAFSQSITGTDTYTTTASGNDASGTDLSSLTGSGTYSEIMVAGGTTTTPSGSYSLSTSETEDALAGALSQTGSLGRYALLTYFVDVSNADANTPGNMNFAPVGRPFVDPPEDLHPRLATSNTAWMGRVNGVNGELASESGTYGFGQMLGLCSQAQRESNVSNNAPALNDVVGALGPELALGAQQFAVALRDSLATIAVGGIVGMACCSVGLVPTALAGGAARAGMDGLFQSFEITAGTQEGWDWGRTGSSFLEGALSALANKACFSGDMPARTKRGDIPWRDVREGDYLLAGDEYNPRGTLEWKRVLEIFVGHARIWHLEAGGQTIRTTAAHRFFAYGKGWIPCHRLQYGDILRSDNGRLVAVDCVYDSGVEERVYNCRVERYHTYFVGCAEWGFAVWAHNAYSSTSGNNAAASRGRTVHKAYASFMRMFGLAAEYTLPSGRRVDAVDFANRIVYELKPNNANAVTRGRSQASRYANELAGIFGGIWTTVIHVY